MADDVVDKTVKKVGGVAAGGVVGGAILAPLAIAGAAAVGLAVAPLVVPITGALILLGMWGGHKATEGS